MKKPTATTTAEGWGRKRAINPRRVSKYSDVGMHFRFVLWAMQLASVDDVTIRRTEQAMGVSRKTAARLRQEWREVTATRTYLAAFKASGITTDTLQGEPT